MARLLNFHSRDKFATEIVPEIVYHLPPNFDPRNYRVMSNTKNMLHATSLRFRRDDFSFQGFAL